MPTRFTPGHVDLPAPFQKLVDTMGQSRVPLPMAGMLPVEGAAAPIVETGAPTKALIRNLLGLDRTSFLGSVYGGYQGILRRIGQYAQAMRDQAAGTTATPPQGQ